MNSRERVMETVAKRSPDRVPVYCGRIDDLDHWLAYGGLKTEEELRTYWGLDLRKTVYKDVFKTKPGKTVWGTDDAWDMGYSSTKTSPLAGAESIQDVEQYDWPDLGNVDFELFKQRNDGMDGQYALISSFGFHPVFCTVCDLFGMEDAMINMAINPELIEAAIEHITAFLLQAMDKALSECSHKAQFFWLGDDFSTQRGMMISPELWRRFLKPAYRKLFELVKSYGLMVWFHSCGTFRPVIGELIDLGMDVWETVQAHLDGNEPQELKKLYGDDLTFFGAINCQKTLPFGTADDVRKEVRERIRVLGNRGGYILGPDHSIQKNMPAENVFAMYDEAKKLTR